MQVRADPADRITEMFQGHEELVAALTAEVEILERLGSGYSQLALLTEAAEYRCLPRAIDEITAVESELGTAELARALVCISLAEGSAEITAEDLLARTRGHQKEEINGLVTEMRRLYLEVTERRSIAVEATERRLAELA